jgi:hypothetical protein
VLGIMTFMNGSWCTTALEHAARSITRGTYVVRDEPHPSR